MNTNLPNNYFISSSLHPLYSSRGTCDTVVREHGSFTRMLESRLEGSRRFYYKFMFFGCVPKYTYVAIYVYVCSQVVTTWLLQISVLRFQQLLQLGQRLLSD